MNNWKNYAGSVLLAGLLLQGCSDTPTEDAPVNTNAKSSAITANTLSALIDNDADKASVDSAKLDFASGASADTNAAADKVKATIAALVADGSLSQEDADALLDSDLNELFMTAYFDAIAQENGIATAPKKIFGIGTALKDAASKVTDKLKDGIVDVLDSSLGNKITNAAFEVVLNSEGVTVFMLDLARQSDTIAQVMLDAIGANWTLVKKMAPMLRTNKEFGEKFAALAYEYEPMGKFFFANINRTNGGVELGLMYDALTDAMILSNDDEASNGQFSGDPGGAIERSTTGYMGLLMERYAVDFFIDPSIGVATKYGNTNAFASLMMNTGAVIPENNVSINHGDGMELTNEQFFYAMFVTPASTDSFVVAMEAVKDNNESTATMFMDNIFLGLGQDAENPDSIQGSYNIIAIGTGMYEGLFGNASHTGYGFTAYTNAFIGFAGLIPTDRYIPYAMAFMDAGYMYAAQADIDVWETAKQTFTDLTSSFSPAPAYAGAPSRSAGMGTISSDWTDDIIDLFLSGWDQVSFSDLTTALLSSDQSVIDTLNAQAIAAYNTVIDGRNADGTINLDYATEITNPALVTNDTVYGFHGLLELAMQEDIFYVNCGTNATDYYAGGYTCENNTSYTMTDAKAAFTLPTFANITWSFAYNAATDGVLAYWDNKVDAQWLADLSENDLIREYLYPAADNTYIPNWLMGIDWLKAPANVSNSSYADIEFNFDAGYMDVYVISSVENLDETFNLEQTIAPIKTIEMTKVAMGDDSIISVDANGQEVGGLYVYKIRLVSPEDTAAALAVLNGLVDDGLAAVGIDSSNAATTVATAE